MTSKGCSMPLPCPLPNLATAASNPPNQACMKEGSHDDRLMLALKVSKPLTGAPGVLAALITSEAAGPSAAGWSGGPVDGLGTVGELVNLSGAGGLGGPLPEGVPALNMSQVGGSTMCGSAMSQAMCVYWFGKAFMGE